MKELILQILKQMAKDFQQVLNVDENLLIHQLKTHTYFGFCTYLDFLNIGQSIDRRVMIELRKDLEDETFCISSKNRHWYPISNNYHTASEVKQFCLQPRLDHINRTIGRLENQSK